MTKHRVSELNGALLDAAVAKAEGFPSFWIDPGSDDRDEACVLGPCRSEDDRFDWCPSTAWEQGGPIIERERITVAAFSAVSGSFNPELDRHAHWRAQVGDDAVDPGNWCQSDEPGADGPTPLIAAMRAYVASKFGEEVELP